MKQIIAMGGGGFSMEPENPLLDRYVLQQAEAVCPAICFLPTASGDAEGYIERFYQYFDKQKCKTSHLSLFHPPMRDIRSYLLKQDIIYVGGGSTKNLIALWKEWGLDKILKEAWEQGVILAGLSAGAICWFQQGLTDSFGDTPEPIDCLGFLEGSCCPHYDGEVKRRPAFTTNIADKNMMEGYALDDGAALHFVDSNLTKAIRSRTDARAYHIRNVNGKAVESQLNIHYLG